MKSSKGEHLISQARSDLSTFLRLVPRLTASPQGEAFWDVCYISKRFFIHAFNLNQLLLLIAQTRKIQYNTNRNSAKEELT